MKAIKSKNPIKDQKPNAWIVNPKDRGRKSIKKDNKVYLKDGQNFEVELFNPLKESVLAEIKVNGKPVSSTGLVLRPGERFYLDCFIDDKKKFVFKTYTVENTEESKEAIGLNGYVEIFFYKEETLKIDNWKQKFTPVIERHYYPVYYPWYQHWWSQPYWYGSSTITISGGTGNIFNNNNYTTTTTLTGGTITTNSSTSNVLYSSNMNISNCSSAGFGNNIFTSNGSNNIGSLTSGSSNAYFSNIETGRIEKGESSSQQFTEVDIQFENLHISSVIYQLLPESQKPIETKDIKKESNVNNFCSDCGRKLLGNENFCPQCGKKLTLSDVILI